MDDAVRPIPSGDKAQRKRFVALERRLLRDEPRFVAETEADLRKRLGGGSAFLEDADLALFVTGDGPGAARCAAIVNRRWQGDRDPGTGFIGYFAAGPGTDGRVGSMLEAAERWLAGRGVTRVLAPFNGDALHGFGAQVDGFDEDPMFPLVWQPPYYAGLLEGAGYRPVLPFWVYEIDFSSERYREVSRRAIDDARCTIRPFEKKRWKAEVEAFRLLLNDTFRDEWEFHAYTSEEMAEFLGALKPVFDERQLLFAEVDGEPAGLCWGLPDWTPLMRSLGGRMGPLQIARFMKGAKRFDRAGLITIGVRDAYRGRGIGATLTASLYRHYEELGLRNAFYYPVNENNTASRRLAESFGGRGRVLYAVFEKTLA